MFEILINLSLALLNGASAYYSYKSGQLGLLAITSFVCGWCLAFTMVAILRRILGR
jgi:uncharacterized membrane protein